MSRLKNALQGYFIQEIKTPNENAPGETWVELGPWIITVDDNSSEESEDTAFYDGNGEPQTEVTSHKLGYSFSGQFDSDDPGMALIEAMIGKSGDARKIWFKVVNAKGTKERVGKATVTEPVAQVGEASAFGEFSCGISFDQTPEWEDIPPAG